MKISERLSLYLDVLRIAAALAVFIGHAGAYLLPGLPRLMISHADEGVAVFFVLSGFVIGMVTDGKERNIGDYLGARALRMYSVVPVALLVTFLADRAGHAIDPTSYDTLSWQSADGYYDSPIAILASLLRALTFTNEAWMQSSTFGSNHAYWSLGFEVPYYLAFGILFFARGPLRILGFGLWLLCVGPQIALFFLLWLAGTLCYYLVRDVPSLPRWAGLTLALAVVPVYGIVKLGFRDYKLPIYDPGALVPSLLSFAYYMVIGIAVACNILGMAALFRGRGPARPTAARMIRWVAGGTFTLYLVHQPLMVLGSSLVTRVGGSASVAAGVTILVLVGCYLFAELGERRKHLVKTLVRKVRTS